MKNTTEEKPFIIDNRPNVEVTSVDYGYVCGREGDAEGEADLTGEFSFTNEKAIQAENADKDWETLLLTLHCKDNGVNLPQK